MISIRPAGIVTAAIAASTSLTGTAFAQWTNHYPKVDDFGHQVYLEQYELPFLSHGPVDPAPSPDGETLAFAADGWLWLMDIETGIATQLTDGPGLDARPRWSGDGTRLSFVRDTGDDTAIVVRDMDSGEETLINSPKIELDPEFSADGAYLFYTSGQSGTLALWRHQLASGTEEQVTDLRSVERNARALSDGSGLVYLHSTYPASSLRLRDFMAGTDESLVDINLPPLLSADIHPSERTLVYTAPQGDDHHLMLVDLDRPGLTRQLTTGDAYALTPAFSADGSSIYYVTPNDDQTFGLQRIATAGGASQAVSVTEWEYSSETGTLTIETVNDEGDAVPARLSVTRADGHAIASPQGPSYFDPQNARWYFYSDGDVSLDLPAGSYDIAAVHGPLSLEATASARIRSGRETSRTVSIEQLWDASEAGYVSADHHIHLNADGQHRMVLSDLLPLMAGEDLDQAAPMAWNRYSRQVDEFIVGDRVQGDNGGVAVQSQEVRSNFHGHVGLIGTDEPFYPWFFGPSTPRFGSADRSNAEVTAFAKEHGALATYVHSIATHDDPLADEEPRMPMELIADTVLDNTVGLELVCMWTSPLGTAELWYRLLNIGQATPATSGTDMMSDFSRAPAIGTARVYARTDGGAADFDSTLDQVRAGKSFLSTGPALLFEIGGAQPGETVETGSQDWSLTLTSAHALDTVEIVINGEVVDTLEGISAGQTRTYQGTTDLPQGGWIAARAHDVGTAGGGTGWPSMAATRFAHSSPVWIGTVGSTENQSQQAAAADLLRGLDASQARYEDAYGETQTPMLDERFAQAREKLQGLLQGD